jgi:hypothetical protein
MRRLSITFLFLFSGYLFSQQRIKPNLFGITTETTFIFNNVRDSVFINKVKAISPKVLRFPGSNFYHYGGVGYGLNLEEIDIWHRAGFPKRARGLLNNTKQRGHQHDYIDDFIILANKINAKVIITANIITAKDYEIIQIIRKIKSNGIEVIGVEMGSELSNQSYNHMMSKDKYIALAKKCSNIIKIYYPEIKITVVAAPLVLNPLNRHSLWNRDLAQENFYDGIIIHNYVKVTTGKDLYGEMITESKEGNSKKNAFNIYKKRALNFFNFDFISIIKKYNSVFFNKPIWITEWNLQYSKITGNTLFQGLFSANYLLELTAVPELQNIELTTFHNLAGRDYGGSIFRTFQRELQVQSTFYPIHMLSKLFEDSSLSIRKNQISEECFRYDVYSDSKSPKYSIFINWSDSFKKMSLKKITSECVVEEYYGKELYSLGDELGAITFSKENRNNVKNLIIKPYSLTIVTE